MHQQIRGAHHIVPSGKISQSIYQIGRELDRMLSIRKFVIREILPSGTSDHRSSVNSLSGKYFFYFPALVSRLTQQREGLKTFPSQLAVVKQGTHADIRFTFVAHYQQRFAVGANDEH